MEAMESHTHGWCHVPSASPHTAQQALGKILQARTYFLPLFVKYFIKCFCPGLTFFSFVVKKKEVFFGEELFFKPSPFLEGKHFDKQIRKLSKVTITSRLFGTLLTCEYFYFPFPFCRDMKPLSPVFQRQNVQAFWGPTVGCEQMCNPGWPPPES